ncbi:AP endonuclease, family 2 [Clostridiales bacterium oral taxon 876 str. F0540]|nr:AP endonuclease, family 2 [Clostridiales bacterium oral taxon 876 str. F0540]
MNYKLGMPSLIELNSIEENIILCKDLGLSFIELNMNLPYCMPHNNNVKRLKELKEKYNIEFTMHFPEEIDFAAFYPTVRRANIEMFSEIAGFAAELDVDKINIHINSGIYFSLPDRKAWIYEANKGEFISNLMHSMRKILDTAKKYDINVCVENTVFPEFIQEAFQELIKLENTYFTWDVGHDASDGFRAREFFQNHTSKISHMHLHDYNGSKNHLALYSGKLDVDEKLAFAKQKGLSVVIEVKTEEALRESVYLLRKKGEKLYGG